MAHAAGCQLVLNPERPDSLSDPLRLARFEDHGKRCWKFKESFGCLIRFVEKRFHLFSQARIAAASQPHVLASCGMRLLERALENQLDSMPGDSFHREFLPRHQAHRESWSPGVMVPALAGVRAGCDNSSGSKL
jgi:hypothetical protein